MNNLMSHKQFLSLAKYLEAHVERLHRDRPSYREVAERAAQELGFDCTENNVRAAAKACDLVWTARRSTGRKASAKYVNRLLARGIVKIAEALDIEVDPDLHNVARGRRVEGPEQREAESAC